MKTAKIKVLYMIQSLGSGGVERQLVELLRAIGSHEEFESEVVVMSNRVHYTEVHDLGAKIHKVERSSRWDFQVFSKLYDIVKRFDPDIIYSWSSLCSMYASPISWVLGVPLLNGMVQNASPSRYLLNKEYRRLKLTSLFSAVILSNSYAGLRAYGVSNKKAVCIYNGFNQDRITNLTSTNEIRGVFNIETRYVVGMIGRFQREKDFTTYFKAADRICRRRNDVTFVAVGEGPDLARFRAIYSHAPRIQIIGPRRDIEAIIGSLTIGVLVSDSRYHGEGIANVIMEYMALGKPVIATRYGGNLEIIQDSVNGFLIPSGDIEQLEQRIFELLDFPQLAARFGAAGRICIAQRFGIERFVQSHVSLFKLLARKKR